MYTHNAWLVRRLAWLPHKSALPSARLVLISAHTHHHPVQHMGKGLPLPGRWRTLAALRVLLKGGCCLSTYARCCSHLAAHVSVACTVFVISLVLFCVGFTSYLWAAAGFTISGGQAMVTLQL